MPEEEADRGQWTIAGVTDMASVSITEFLEVSILYITDKMRSSLVVFSADSVFICRLAALHIH